MGYVDSYNLYAYVGNNPINYVDPFGLEKLANLYNMSSGAYIGANVLSIGAGFVPLLGEAQDLSMAIGGYDLITGDRLSTTDRIIAAAALLLPFVGASMLLKAKKGIQASGNISSIVKNQGGYVNLAQWFGRKTPKLLKNRIPEDLESLDLIRTAGNAKIIRGIGFSGGKAKNLLNGNTLDGTYKYVIQDGKITLGKGIRSDGNEIKHADLVGGESVHAAGRVSFSKGKITQLSNFSGHYLPSAEHLYYARDVFNAKGANITDEMLDFLMK